MMILLMFFRNHYAINLVVTMKPLWDLVCKDKISKLNCLFMENYASHDLIIIQINRLIILCFDSHK
jgi:hypothetical protein